MILPLEQLKILREKEAKLSYQLVRRNDYINSLDITDLGDSHTVKPTDHFSDTSFSMTFHELKKIRDVLINSTYLKQRVVDRIEIGTKFLFQFFGEEEICDYILVEDAIGVGSMDGFISTKSPIGKQLLGKKDGDILTDIGAVLEIKKDICDYDHFIKEKKYKTRVGSRERALTKELNLLKKSDTSALEEYRKRNMITASQKKLLEIEKLCLLNHPSKSSQRLHYIEKVLKTVPVASLPTDDTVGIGSIVSIQYATKDEVNTWSGEVIHKAESTELSSCYIERISTFGALIMGLRNGEEFIYRNGFSHKSIKGKILDVNNNGTELRKEDVFSYQKRK